MWCVKGKELNNPLLLQQHLLYSVSFNYFMFPIFNKPAILSIDHTMGTFLGWQSIAWDTKIKKQTWILTLTIHWSIPLVDWSNNHQIAESTYQRQKLHPFKSCILQINAVFAFWEMSSSQQFECSFVKTHLICCQFFGCVCWDLLQQQCVNTWHPRIRYIKNTAHPRNYFQSSVFA